MWNYLGDEAVCVLLLVFTGWIIVNREVYKEKKVYLIEEHM